MPDISKITLPSGTTYDIKDAVARQMLSGGVSFAICTQASNTPKDVEWDNSGTTVTGTMDASASTQGTFYLVPTSGSGSNIYAEYVTIEDGDNYSWEKIGTTDVDLSDLGDLAYKDTASATYTPAGTVSQPTFTGTSLTSTGSFTPSGSVSAPTISVSSAGSTITIHNPTKATVATAVTAAAPGAAAPSNSITYYSVSNETLSFYQLGYNTGDSISTSDVTVKTGDASYESTAPEFTGTSGSVSVSGTPEGTVSQPSFSGTQATITAS